MEALLGLTQILGTREVTREQVGANRARMESAKASGRPMAPLPLRPRPAVPALLPISKSSWWAGVADGRYPKPVSVGARSMWRARDIEALLERLGAGEK
jgi:predicted DNA-binding transcriptional regulator AlpA